MAHYIPLRGSRRYHCLVTFVKTEDKTACRFWDLSNTGALPVPWTSFQRFTLVSPLLLSLSVFASCEDDCHCHHWGWRLGERYSFPCFGKGMGDAVPLCLKSSRHCSAKNHGGVITLCSRFAHHDDKFKPESRLNAIDFSPPRSGRCIHRTLQCNGEDDCGDMSDEVGCRKVPKPCRQEVEEFWGIEDLAKGWVRPGNVMCKRCFPPKSACSSVTLVLLPFLSESTSWTVTWREWCLTTDTMAAAACPSTSRMSGSGSLTTCNSTLSRWRCPTITVLSHEYCVKVDMNGL